MWSRWEMQTRRWCSFSYQWTATRSGPQVHTCNSDFFFTLYAEPDSSLLTVTFKVWAHLSWLFIFSLKKYIMNQIFISLKKTAGILKSFSYANIFCHINCGRKKKRYWERRNRDENSTCHQPGHTLPKANDDYWLGLEKSFTSFLLTSTIIYFFTSYNQMRLTLSLFLFRVLATSSKCTILGLEVSYWLTIVLGLHNRKQAFVFDG